MKELIKNTVFKIKTAGAVITLESGPKVKGFVPVIINSNASIEPSIKAGKNFTVRGRFGWSKMKGRVCKLLLFKYLPAKIYEILKSQFHGHGL